MNAEQEVFRLLQESGAVLVRQNKHLVYRLPNGRNFVIAKTSSDPQRAAKNSLSELRRGLGASRAALNQESIVMEEPQETISKALLSDASRQDLPAQPKMSDLRSRVESMIAGEEAAQEQLMAEAQKLERRVQMLKALLPFADDPAMEAALKAITLSPAQPRSAPAPALPEPPQQITERVQVTRQLVLAATQTFDATFTVNDVMALMTGGREINGEERQRVRSSIAQAMVSLFERGELIREAEGLGKRQATWRKAVLNGRGNGVGVRA